MSTYKLTYFDGRGRAEIIRFVFAQAGVKYEDNRIEGAKWPVLKPNTPFGTLPILEVDGAMLGGSIPIARFVAQRCGVAGSNDVENAMIDGICDSAMGMLDTVVDTYLLEKDEEKKAATKKKILETTIPNCLGFLEKQINTNKSPGGWLVGSKVTYADFYLYTATNMLKAVDEKVLEKFPAITKMKEAVEALPNIAKWLKERPVTSF